MQRGRWWWGCDWLVGDACHGVELLWCAESFSRADREAVQVGEGGCDLGARPEGVCGVLRAPGGHQGLAPGQAFAGRLVAGGVDLRGQLPVEGCGLGGGLVVACCLHGVSQGPHEPAGEDFRAGGGARLVTPDGAPCLAQVAFKMGFEFAGSGAETICSLTGIFGEDDIALPCVMPDAGQCAVGGDEVGRVKVVVVVDAVLPVVECVDGLDGELCNHERQAEVGQRREYGYPLTPTDHEAVHNQHAH